MIHSVTTVLILNNSPEVLEGKDSDFIVDYLNQFNCVGACTFINQNQILSSSHHSESEILDVIEVGGNNASSLNAQHNIKVLPLSAIEGEHNWSVMAQTLPKALPEKFAVHVEGGVINDFFSENESTAILKIFDYGIEGAAPEDIITIDGNEAYLGEMHSNTDTEVDLSEVFS